MKLELFRWFFEKYKNNKFYENPSSGSRVVPCEQMDGRTDMTKVKVTFRNFAKASKKEKYEKKNSSQMLSASCISKPLPY
jgi:hypothetical protein